MPTDKFSELQSIAKDLRKTVIEMLVEAGSGHPAGSLGTAEIFSVLFFETLNINPKKPNDPKRDRFVLSNGHICPILYAALAKKGYFPEKELWKLRKIGSNLEGHPVYGKVPGIENTSGSLGQGLSQAIGMAIASKADMLNNRIYCMTGDGEMDEGQIWEAALFAPNKRLNNVTWIIDRNNIQSDGPTEEIMPLENLREKLESFGWYVIEIDGHNIEEIVDAFNMAKSISQRPTVIIAHTIPGKGVEFMEYKFEWHAKPLSKEQAREALKSINSLGGKLKNI